MFYSKSVFATSLAGFLALASAQGGSADAGEGILGVWHTTDDKSRIEVFKQGSHYSAKIISLKEPNWPANDEQGMGGKPKNDRNNPNPSLRSRTIIGIQFLNGFVYEGKGVWKEGTVYDPENGKTYHGKLRLKDANHLELRGYVGISLFGRTEVWSR